MRGVEFSIIQRFVGSWTRPIVWIEKLFTPCELEMRSIESRTKVGCLVSGEIVER